MSQKPDTGDSSSSPTESLCRDCLIVHSQPLVRCPPCGSPRVISHPELRALTIAHIDCDAFYASIEKRDHPELADKPLIVGGGRRGVVSTACYIARIFGVRSAMPMFEALKACPDAVVIKPDMSKYVGVARQIREMMETLTPAVEPLSIDEAFLDLTGTERLHHATPAIVLAHFQRRVEAEIGVTVSVGLSHNKFLAKIASDLDKPRGFAVIGKAETQSFLAAQPVSLIWGVGAAMQKRLAGDGIWTIGQLQEIDERALARRYGAMGLRLAKLSRGLDARPIVTERMPKTLSAETTFDEDTGDSNILLPQLRELSEKLAQRLKAKDMSGMGIVLKLKTRDFQLRTRTTQAPSPTNLADRIYRTGREMLLRELDGTRYRLIGIGVAGLRFGAGGDTGDVLDPASVKRAQAEAAMDEIRAKFGRDRLELGLTFRPDQPRSR